MFINEGGCVISCADGGIFKFLTVSMCVTTPRFMTNDDQEGQLTTTFSNKKNTIFRDFDKTDKTVHSENS